MIKMVSNTEIEVQLAEITFTRFYNNERNCSRNFRFSPIETILIVRMVLSTEKLLNVLQSREITTTELYTALNTLVAKKIEIQKSPISNFRLCSTLLSVLCSESKWVLMDLQMKQTCAQLLASNVGLEMVVRNLKKGIDSLSNLDSTTEMDAMSFDIKTGLTLSGTSYFQVKQETISTDDIIKTKSAVGDDSDLIIKEQKSTKTTQSLSQVEQANEQETVSLNLPLNKETTTIQFDILLNILNSQLDSVLKNFLDMKNTSSASFKNFKSLLSIKINEVLGQGLIYLLDNPYSLTIGSFSVSKAQIKDAIELYSSKLINSLLSRDIPNFTISEIICELLRRDKSAWSEILTNWQKFLDSIPELGSSSRRESNQLTVIQSLTTHLFNNTIPTLDSANEWQVVINSWIKKLQEINVSKQVYQELVYKLCEDSNNSLRNFVWLTSINYVSYEWVKTSINKFGSKEYISNTPLPLQNLYTINISFMCGLLNTSQIAEIAKNRLFLNAITNRLESKVEEIRQLGMIIADLIYEIENNKPLFTSPDYQRNRVKFLLPIQAFRKVELNKKLSLASAIDFILSKNNSISIKQSEDKIVEREQPLIMELDYDSDADDSDLEDTSVPRRPTVTKPIYLKDLLDYLTCETEKDNKTFYKRGISFSIGIEMVRLKRNTAELSFYTSKLLDAISNINDFGFPDLPKDIKSNTSKQEAFNIWKISFMIAVIVSSPALSFQHLFKCFLENDISTPQRVQILSAIGFSCRELCGKDEEDVFIWGKNNDKKVQPKSLTGSGHDEFKNADKKIQEIPYVDDFSKTILKNENISSGVVIRKSRKLELDKTSTVDVNKKIVTSYINRELPKIFFSLISIWHEINSQTGGQGFMVGNMSEILNSHYLSITSMVFKCAVPSSIDIVEMSREMLTIVREQLIILDSSKEFKQLMFVGVAKCAGALVLGNESVVKILLNTQTMDIVDLLKVLTTVMNENGETVTDIISMSIGAKVVLELQSILKGSG